MPITISSQLEAHIEGEVTTLARLLKVTRKDGVQLFFTDAVEAVVYDGDTYRADVSFTSSAIFQNASLQSAQTVTVTSVMDDLGFVEADLRQRKYDEARVDIFIVNYEDPSQGVIQKFRGLINEIKLTDKGRVEFEVLTDGATNAGGDVAFEKYSATCRASLGDARCNVDIEALKVAITVDAVSGQVVGASEITQAENFWVGGFIKWATGNNTGVTNPIVSSNLATNSVTLAGQPLQEVQVGDTAFLYPGCDKTLATCKNVYNNVVNMRAEPFVPSSVTINTEEVAPAGNSLPG
jgi:uncharacterized phage protein (TIGR02218 family)